MTTPRDSDQQYPPEIQAIFDREKKVKEFEETEPFIQRLKDLKSLSQQSGQQKGEGTYTISTQDRRFTAYTGYPVKYAAVTEWVMEGDNRALPERPLIRLRYLGDFEVSVIVNNERFSKWKTLEEPRESEIYPEMEKGLIPWDYPTGPIWIRGAADSMGPNTLQALRTLTARALISLKPKEELPEY